MAIYNIKRVNHFIRGLLTTTVCLTSSLLLGMHSVHGDDNYSTNHSYVATANDNVIPDNINGYVKQGLVNSAWENNNGQLLNGWQTVNGNWYSFNNGQPSKGWQAIDNNWYYMNPTTSQMEVGLQKINNQTYYLNERHDGTYGAMKTGWQVINNSWYYFQNNGAGNTGWNWIDNNWYYFNPTTSQMEVGLQKINNQTYYLNENHDGTYGAMRLGWQFVDGHWYALKSDGSAYLGWAELGGNNYYFDPDSAQMATGDTVIDGNHYYFEPISGHQLKGQLISVNGKLSYYDSQSGIRQTSLVTNGHTYLFSSVDGGLESSSLANGLNQIADQTFYYDQESHQFVSNTWKQVNGKWYYFDNTGHATKGWYQSAAGNWFFFNSDGSAQTGWYQSGAGNWYYFDPTNAWAQKGWFKSPAGCWYYFDPTNAWAQKGWFKSPAGYWYYFDQQNANALTGWQYINGNWYYFDLTNTNAVTGWQKIDGAWYFFKASCAMAANEAFTDGSKYYQADTNGHTSEITNSHAAFLASIKQAAIDGWYQYGVLPSVTGAQAILESGWGQSALATQGHNLFGIKGNYNGQSIYMRTAEYGGGGYYYINAAFRRYPSNYESVVDHGRFLAVNSRYHNLLWDRNYRDVTAKLQSDGYATAPTYASSLNRVIEANGLTAWDQAL